MAPLRESSEECAIQLYHYTPQDEIDKGKFCLSANKSNPKELFEALRKNNLNNNRNDVKNLYGELKIPAEERFKLCEDNLDEDLREFMRAIIQKAIEELNLLTKYMNYFHKNYMLNVPRFNNGCWKDKMIEFEKKEFDPRPSLRRLEEENEENLVGPI
ncbi:hypothetical protein Glove_139g284 [Diversispora epigaea]|uniref:Uncharacterized protein n=1 Tax=Diversispora epigaea TaxID=1348612 RepID=A0A397IVP8_9GLOM|nr:hypothetical protein Glove_139g284 [Diversispora epigaea]